jgi:hypothetical protein
LQQLQRSASGTERIVGVDGLLGDEASVNTSTF